MKKKDKIRLLEKDLSIMKQNQEYLLKVIKDKNHWLDKWRSEAQRLIKLV